MNLGVAPAELREGDAAAPAGEEARIVEVDDIARLRDALGAAQRHVLDMAHDGDARCHAARHSTPESPTSQVGAGGYHRDHAGRAGALGCDAAAERVEQARRAAEGIENVAFVMEDILHPALDPESFDFVQ
jgi:hypothetical protein